MTDEINKRYGTGTYIALIAMGLAGNYFHFPLFHNISLIFGSIFSMLALQLFGRGRAVLAAALISGYTYFLWNHPFAMVIMTVEVLIVSLLIERRSIGLVQADVLYWLFVGMPLVYVLYHFLMKTQLENTHINMVKQAVNGIANAVLARLIFSGYLLNTGQKKIPLREIVYNLLAFFVLFPALIMLAIDSRVDYRETDLNIRGTLLQNKQVLAQRLNAWIANKKNIVSTLAEDAVSSSPQQMQSFLELATKSDADFLRIGLLDRDARSTAYYPLVDELGLTTIGKNFADRPYLPALKQTLKPMMSESILSRLGTPRSMVVVLAPVISHGKYMGYISGTLGMEKMREYLDLIMNNNSMYYLLLDKNSNVIMTNRTDQMAMKPFTRGHGLLVHLDSGIEQWFPTQPLNTPISDRVKNSYYISEVAIGAMGEWKLVLEQPVAPMQNSLFKSYANKLTMLFLVLIVALGFAEFLSRRIASTLRTLGSLTRELPNKLEKNNKKIIWPESGVDETSLLVDNFKVMHDSISSQFASINQLNESLEQRVLERTSELSLSEQRLLEILNLSPIAVRISLIRERRVVFNNFAYNKLLKKFDAVGEDPGKYHVRAEDYEEIIQTIKQGKSVINRLIELNFSSGPNAWTLASYMPMQYQGEDAVLGWLYDITERQKMENDLHASSVELKLANAQIEEEREKLVQRVSERTFQLELANHAKDSFLATMSHEIRTPLGGLLGLMEVLSHSTLDVKQEALVTAALGSGKNLLRIVNDILDWSKIEAGKLELVPYTGSITEMLNGVLDIYVRIASEKGLQLEVTIDPALSPVHYTDFLRISQILNNFTSNAIKFSQQGSIELRAERRSQHTDFEEICFSVKDDGIGLSQAQQEHLFKEYIQVHTDTARMYGGTGLGLAICRKLAELMGGRLSVQSIAGEGSIFSLTVNLKVANQDAQQDFLEGVNNYVHHINQPQDHDFTLQLAAEQYSLLIVDDHPINRMLLKHQLELLGIQTEVAQSGMQALSLWQSRHIDLIITDCHMPEMDGYEMTYRIRELEKQKGSKRIPIIAWTANVMADVMEQCYATGIDDILTKPTGLNALREMLAKWLDKPHI